ncbi:MAG: ribonucleotide-diphosphate reductase subunit beta, partial [Pontibacterium sp.]
MHSRSYTHIIRNVYPNPDDVFDNIMNIKPIVECGQDISKYYDQLLDYTIGSAYGNYGHKKALWLALNAVNALEGIRFYVSFACSWAFAELKKMEGNAKIIKFIARDENTHLAGTQTIIKRLPDDDKDFAKIKKECEEEVTQIFKDVVKQEQEWADYLFENGSMIGLNAELLKQYVEWIACKRMKAIMIPCPYDVPAANPLPWTQKWIAGGSVQVAPQETEISSYVVGGVKKDVQEDTF